MIGWRGRSGKKSRLEPVRISLTPKVVKRGGRVRKLVLTLKEGAKQANKSIYYSVRLGFDFKNGLIFGLVVDGVGGSMFSFESFSIPVQRLYTEFQLPVYPGTG